jgi:hypothetical protein
MVEAIAATLGEHFASVHAVNVADTFNTVMVATQEKTHPDNLVANLSQVEHPLLRDATLMAVDNLHALAGDGIVLTDDRAPVEQITNAIVLRYLLLGE